VADPALGFVVDIFFVFKLLKGLVFKVLPDVFGFVGGFLFCAYRLLPSTGSKLTF